LLKNLTVLLIDDDFVVRHLLGEESWEKRFKTLVDRELFLSHGDLGVGNISNTGRSSWHELVSEELKFGEWFLVY